MGIVQILVDSGIVCGYPLSAEVESVINAVLQGLPLKVSVRITGFGFRQSPKPGELSARTVLVRPT